MAFSFSYPLANFENTKLDSAFLDPKYLRVFGSNHQGVDLNGRYGGSTDLGWPVLSMFPGVVVEKQGQNGWGACVLVRADDWVRRYFEAKLQLRLKTLEVCYAHVFGIVVTEGQRVDAGQVLASIGDASRNIKGQLQPKWKRYVPHLHLEIRKLTGPAIWRQSGRTKADIKRSHLDPQLFLSSDAFCDGGALVPTGRRVSNYRVVSLNGVETDNDVVTMNTVGDKLYIETVKGAKTDSARLRAALIQLANSL